MVIPRVWKDEYGRSMPATLYPGFDADLIPIPVLGNGSVPLHWYRINAAKLLRAVQPDVVYSHNEAYALSTIQWSRANARTGRKPFGFFSCQNLVKRYPIPFRQGESAVYRNSSFFFPITETVDQVHREKGYRGSSTIIPLGFDPEKYHTTVDIETRQRKASNRSQRLAFVGRIVEEKGLVTLAQALGKIRDLDWELIIVGAGPFEGDVKEAMRQHGVAGRVQWRGFVRHDETAKFFDSVDCLVLPSETRPNWREQFGRVIVESMACGTPVVGSDSGEIPNIIRQTGGGLVFAEADAESCASSLRKIITQHDARAAMAIAGNRYVHQHYSLSALADRFADAIENAT
ncbi:GDP-mannose-dependent alpha-(1-6)-phosphatidylinositol monomannoside mannosyltransferase [Rosistilla carotiformis]|uniref:GDP-mannose-dependent alpha-(1-6)-phosphatidylinositol monomannoside mannosyltransferase n=2 Tax=Rosistilla carotiformis TaxID=2528017 RepID=A0A518JLG8_9BACT|nr:GDP-mannose-dependent alpha-(1-6)-phosphatidylinositol monomannoside mannosyltransferase [Rosistilla carotiformis]